LAALETSIVSNFSAQQLIDCSTEYGNQGCNGGNIENSFWYVIDKGITTDTQYPYTGQQQNCSYTEAKKVFQNSECANIKPNSTRALESALVEQPVAVMVSSNSLGFQLYRRGIFSGKCGTVANHGMVLIGYGKMYE
jgi:cathepsin L